MMRRTGEGDQFTVKVSFVELVRLPDVPVSVIVLVPEGVPPAGVWWLPHPSRSSVSGNNPTKPNLGESRCIRIQQRKKRKAITARIACIASGGNL